VTDAIIPLAATYAATLAALAHIDLAHARLGSIRGMREAVSQWLRSVVRALARIIVEALTPPPQPRPHKPYRPSRIVARRRRERLAAIAAATRRAAQSVPARAGIPVAATVPPRFVAAGPRMWAIVPDPIPRDAKETVPMLPRYLSGRLHMPDAVAS
jgi:hypothetical protein